MYSQFISKISLSGLDEDEDEGKAMSPWEPDVPQTSVRPPDVADVVMRPRGGKKRRAWEQWSSSDKDAFFEAINECGKDFDGIQVGSLNCFDSMPLIICCNVREETIYVK